MLSIKEEIFDLLHNFKQESGYVDWALVLENDETFDLAIDALDSIINNFALIDSVPESRKIQIIGQLAIARSQLEHFYADEEKEKDFVRTGESILNLVHQLMNASDWLVKAEEHFDEFERLNESAAAREELSIKDFEKFTPVFLAVSIVTFVTVDQDMDTGYENL